MVMVMVKIQESTGLSLLLSLFTSGYTAWLERTTSAHLCLVDVEQMYPKQRIVRLACVCKPSLCRLTEQPAQHSLFCKAGCAI